MFGNLVFQDIKLNISPEKMWILSSLPGSIWRAGWEAMELGFKPDDFDDVKLPGSSWDVEELASEEIRKRIDSDFYFRKYSIAGLNNAILVE
ncbi:hypothetical protein HD806DRAFT_531195 [Xylariaceae sp. AK1471]|nr:hypothetical protein HD806DRAFT_531195 [Xylariaceae sp. AK1471]